MLRFFWMMAALLTLCIDHASAQWTIQDSHTTASLRGIHYVGDGIAWASGTGGTVLRTLDMGKTWTQCAVPPDAEKLDFRGVQAFNAQTALVMSSGKGDLSRLYKTTDGCRTWKLAFTNPDAEGFWDAFTAEHSEEGDEYILVGDPVGGRFATFQSMGGGTVLEKVDAGGLLALEGEGAFAASNSSEDINIDRLTAVLGTGGPKGARVFVLCGSCDGEDGWIAHSLVGFVTGASAGVFSVKNHARDWVVVGGDYLKPALTVANAAVSHDDGKTWHTSRSFPHGYRSSVAYSEKRKAWITVGPNGSDVSSDNGLTWHPLKPGKDESPEADKNWNALSLPFVVGPKGRIGILREGALK